MAGQKDRTETREDDPQWPVGQLFTSVLIAFVEVALLRRLGDVGQIVADVVLFVALPMSVLYLLPQTRWLVVAPWLALARGLGRLGDGKDARDHLKEQASDAGGRVIPARGLPRVGFHVANTLTTLRLLLTPAILVAGLSAEWPLLYVVFLIANVTDVLDGFVARATGGTSPFGKAFDPSVDMLMNVAALIGLTGGMVRTRAWSVLLLLWVAYASFMFYRQRFAPGGSPQAKIASGAWRICLGGAMLLLLIGLPSESLAIRMEATFSIGSLVVIGLILLVAGAAHELWVVRLDGRRRI